MVEQNLKRIEGKLESSCGGGVPDVFSITGKSKSVFPAAYEEYSSQIASLEENICLYLTVRGSLERDVSVASLLWLQQAGHHGVVGTGWSFGNLDEEDDCLAPWPFFLPIEQGNEVF